ncbi:alanine racemase [Novosphingobium sp. PS1R-30]|uniref:alanine racemase n=1 Tax=Novosphingobium anseongense TaxID=3133436 RepID=A0ABU8RSK0_9SPHN|nr:MAG: alanine racemase [Novosphingobium sp.]
MSLPELPPAALRLDVDRDALAANWRTLDALSGQAAAGAAVKANAYGLGVPVVVPVLRDAGCRSFFVAHWREVAAVAEHVPASAISVLHGPLTAADAAYAKALGVKPVINSVPQARLWLDAGGGRCHLMVDTGMNRLGLPMAELGDDTIARLEIDVLLSHLASADEDVALNEVQRGRWEEARRAVAHRRASLANSAGIALGAAYHGDLTRPGLALYGGIPRAELSDRLAQVARPMAAILQVREVAAGDTLGYNATFTAPAPMRVGTIALGYADGYLRCWSGKGIMLSQGRRLPVLGRVSMDMTIIDLSAAPDLREGDWVEAEYEPVAAAAQSGLSQYELFTLLGARFGR